MGNFLHQPQKTQQELDQDPVYFMNMIAFYKEWIPIYDKRIEGIREKMKEAGFSEEYLKTIDKLPHQHRIYLIKRVEKPDLATLKQEFYLKTLLMLRQSYYMELKLKLYQPIYPDDPSIREFWESDYGKNIYRYKLGYRSIFCYLESNPNQNLKERIMGNFLHRPKQTEQELDQDPGYVMNMIEFYEKWISIYDKGIKWISEEMKEVGFRDEYLKTIDKLPHEHRIYLRKRLKKPNVVTIKKKFYLKTLLMLRQSYYMELKLKLYQQIFPDDPSIREFWESDYGKKIYRYKLD